MWPEATLDKHSNDFDDDERVGKNEGCLGCLFTNVSGSLTLHPETRVGLISMEILEVLLLRDSSKDDETSALWRRVSQNVLQQETAGVFE